WARLRQHGEHPMPALSQAIDAVFDARIGDISGRGKLATDMREIWLMQPRFRAGFDFLRLRADAGELPVELAEWWEDFSLGDDAEREALIEVAREAGKPKRGSQAPRRSPAPAAAENAGAPVGGHAEPGEPGEPAAEAGDEAPRKRRRRRRKPSGGRSGEGGARAGDPPQSFSPGHDVD